MKLESSKSRVNNEKGSKIKGKSTKIAPAFTKNKPNFKTSEIVVSSFDISIYEISPAWRGEKANPIKPNTNPIQTQFLLRPKMNTNSYYKKIYRIKTPTGGKKANPIKPNQTQFNRLYLTNRQSFDIMVSD